MDRRRWRRLAAPAAVRRGRPVRPVRDGIPRPAGCSSAGPGPRCWRRCARGFPRARATWHGRFARGRVLDTTATRWPRPRPQGGARCTTSARWTTSLRFRSPSPIVHVDAPPVVADSAFPPVAPRGRGSRTLLTRWCSAWTTRRWCRCTAWTARTAATGDVSAAPASRARYQACSRAQDDKVYHALAPPLSGRAFPHVHRSRLERGEPSSALREGARRVQTAKPWSDVLERGADAWLYRLQPVTGASTPAARTPGGPGRAILMTACIPNWATWTRTTKRARCSCSPRRSASRPVTGERR